MVALVHCQDRTCHNESCAVQHIAERRDTVDENLWSSMGGRDRKAHKVQSRGEVETVVLFHGVENYSSKGKVHTTAWMVERTWFGLWNRLFYGFCQLVCSGIRLPVPQDLPLLERSRLCQVDRP
jgi:hypothetical protein